MEVHGIARMRINPCTHGCRDTVGVVAFVASIFTLMLALFIMVKDLR